MSKYNFQPINDYSVELGAFFNGSYGIHLLPPKKSSTTNRFYPVVNYNNYSSSSYSNEKDMLRADVRYRLFFFLNLTGNNNGKYVNEEIIFGESHVYNIQQNVNKLLELFQNNNIWGSQEYMNTNYPLEGWFGNKTLYLNPTYISGRNNENIPGFNITFNGENNLVAQVSANQIYTMLFTISNFNFDSYRLQMINLYQSATLETKLDALLLNAGLHDAPDYRNNPNMFINANGRSFGAQQNSSMGGSANNFYNNKQFGSNNNQQQAKSTSGNSSNPFAQAASMSFGSGSGLKKPQVGNGNSIFGNTPMAGKNMAQKQPEPAKQPAPESTDDPFANTEVDSVNISDEDLSFDVSKEETKSEDPKKETSSNPFSGGLANFKPTGKYEEEASVTDINDSEIDDQLFGD